jgi:replicative DNA helicase
MSQRNYVRRFIVESSSILLNKYRNNQLDDYDIRAIDFAASNLVRLPIHIFDSPKCTPNKIRKDAKAVIKRKGKLDFIIVDYLQLMRSDEKSGNREQEIGSISMELKAISKELDIPVLALAQLNKEWGKDGGAQRPKTAHLRESAGIEHSADLIMFVYRPELYFEYGSHPDEQYSRDSIGEAEYNMISELLIGKARDGQVNLKVVENFIGGFMRFTSKGQAQNQDPFITGDSEPENSDLLAPF